MICGPIFYFDQPVVCIGADDTTNETSIPVPNAYFKSVLAETRRGALHMWSFIVPNAAADEPVSTFQVPTRRVEQFAGIKLWENLMGAKVEREKRGRRRYFGS